MKPHNVKGNIRISAAEEASAILKNLTLKDNENKNYKDEKLSVDVMKNVPDNLQDFASNLYGAVEGSEDVPSSYPAKAQARGRDTVVPFPVSTVSVEQETTTPQKK